ncbi:MAG: YjgN family protein [Opitutaceae bacterium]
MVWREGMAGWQPYGAKQTTVSVAPGGASGEGPARLIFTGKAGEYFKIWIVNLLLTVVTLGIYAAWAKVRTKRYFYGNTHLFGHAFEYLGNPVRILIGNLIVISLFVALNVAQLVSLAVWFGLFLLLMVAIPWFVVRALVFNARNSAWRGLKFRFDGRYWRAFCIFVLMPLAVPLTLGLAYPWLARVRRDWVVSRHACGITSFSFSGMLGEFYKIYLAAFACFLPLVLAYIALIATVAMAEKSGQPPSPMLGFLVLGIFPALLLAYAGAIYLRVRLFNYSWNNTQIGPHTFRGHMEFWPFAGIQVSNAILTGVTFGLMYPWARIRVAQYTANSLEAIPGGSLDEFVASSQPEASAVGEAASDIFDLDVGIDFGL